MNNTREKLIELLVNSPGLCTLTGKVEEFVENADWLIANGVTVQKCGRWVKHNFLGHDQFACSECQTLGSPQWKRCPVCEAKMDGGNEDG